jgi:predicted RNA-binding protein with RPS1 domain
VHISDISWTKRIKHPSELYKKADVVQAIVLNIDKDNERFSLGIKQLQKDPWETIPERYAVGDKITGTITNVTDFGLFVELEEGIEGLAHVSEVSREKIKTPVGRFQVGDIISAKVININPKERRIGLSIKQLERDEEHDLVVNYLSTYQGSQSSLGELLKDNLKEKGSDEEPPVEDEKPPDEELMDQEVASEEPADEAAGDEETPSDQDITDQVSETPVEEVEEADTQDEATDDVAEQAPPDETQEAEDPISQEAVEPETGEEETDKEV